MGTVAILRLRAHWRFFLFFGWFLLFFRVVFLFLGGLLGGSGGVLVWFFGLEVGWFG